jgi:uroporphyrinogen decarboxylase
MLRALARERPDRLPATVHQWQKYHLDTFLGGMSDLEAFGTFGLDASIQYFQDMGQFWLTDADLTGFSTPEWRDGIEVLDADPDHRVCRHTITTPGGVLTYRTEGNRMTTWVTEHLIKHDDDIRLIEKYMPVPSLDRTPVARAYDAVGDRGILRGFVWGDQAGCWQHAACLIDVQALILRTFDSPGWVHELLRILLGKKLRFIESMKGARFDLIETGGGAASSTLISPALHAAYCLPYDRKMHDALHALGFTVVYHTWEFKAKVGGRLALVGGLDQFNVLTEGSPEAIRAKVSELFEKVGADGGYILSCCDHFFETPPENIRIYAEAARACVY